MTPKTKIILNSNTNFFEMLDHQKGIQDGVSLAYNVDTDKLTIGMALEAAKFNNEFYLRGLVEGFQSIQEALNKKVEDIEDVPTPSEETESLPQDIQPNLV